MRRLTLLLAALVAVLVAQATDPSFLGVVPDKSVDISVQGFSGTGLFEQVAAKARRPRPFARRRHPLTHFNGKPIEDGDDLSFFLRKARPGAKVSLDWVRENGRMKGVAAYCPGRRGRRHHRQGGSGAP